MTGNVTAPSSYYPLMLDLRGKRCLVVGAGKAAAKRISALRQAGAVVKVVAPDASGEALEMIAGGEVEWEKRDFVQDDLEGQFLVLAMSDSPETNEGIEELCRRKGILVCSNSSQSSGDVIFPSVIRKGEITIAISTGGRSPALSRMIREELEAALDERVPLLCEVLGDARRELKGRSVKAAYEQWMGAMDGHFLKLLEEGKLREAEERLILSLSRKLGGRRSLLAWGLSHRTSPLSAIEALACDASSREELLRELKARLESVVLLDTCNRFEIYCYGTVEELKEALESVVFKRLPAREGSDIQPYLKADREAIRHILRVACGLDSLIPGESQIRSQLRKAARAADSVGALRNPLREVLQRIMSSARELCNEHKVQDPANSVMGAAVELLTSQLKDPGDKRVLIIGTGQAGLTAFHLLRERGYGKLWLMGGDPDRLSYLSRRLGVETLHYDALKESLIKVDGVISASSRRGQLIGREELEPLLEKRSSSPLVIVDIAVPRDFPRDCSGLRGIVLLGIEDMEGLHPVKDPQLEEMEKRLEEETERICTWWEERKSSPLAVLVRREALDFKEKTLEEIYSKLKLSDEERSFLEEKIELLLNRALHRPIQLVKATCGRLVQDEAVSDRR